MKPFSLITAITAAAALALTGCSGTGDKSSPAAAVAPLGAAATAATTTAGAGATADAGRITTVGTGKVSGTPDVMTISLGVETSGASAREALDQNTALANDVITVLKESGVDPADLQTSQLRVNPAYDDNSQITGYQVTNTVNATLRDIAAAGTIIDAVAEKGGDAVRVRQLEFAIYDDTALLAAARAEAVQQAQAQAQQLTDAAGVQLGPIRSISESSFSTPTAYYAAASDAAAAPVPLEPGSEELSITVQVVYDIAA